MNRLTAWLKELAHGHIHLPRLASSDRRGAIDRRSGVDRRAGDLRSVLTDEEITFLLKHR